MQYYSNLALNSMEELQRQGGEWCELGSAQCSHAFLWASERSGEEGHMHSSMRRHKTKLDHHKKIPQANPRPQVAEISVGISPLMSLGIFISSISESDSL